MTTQLPGFGVDPNAPVPALPGSGPQKPPKPSDLPGYPLLISHYLGVLAKAGFDVKQDGSATANFMWDWAVQQSDNTVIKFGGIPGELIRDEKGTSTPPPLVGA